MSRKFTLRDLKKIIKSVIREGIESNFFQEFHDMNGNLKDQNVSKIVRKKLEDNVYVEQFMEYYKNLELEEEDRGYDTIYYTGKIDGFMVEVNIPEVYDYHDYMNMSEEDQELMFTEIGNNPTQEEEDEWIENHMEQKRMDVESEYYDHQNEERFTTLGTIWETGEFEDITICRAQDGFQLKLILGK